MEEKYGTLENMEVKKVIPKLYQLLAAGIILYGIYFLCKIIYNMILGIDVPNELLESCNIQLTQAFIDGKVPYLRESLVPLGQRPAVNYEYPFLTSIFAAGISYLLGGNVIPAHYLLSIISIVGTGVIGAIIVKRYSITYVGSTFAFVTLMYCHWRYGYIGAAPDSFGLFLSIITLYLVTCESIKNKPLVGAIGITLCFYTKQYFIFIAISIFVFMCLYSFSEGIRLFLFTTIMLIITGTLITLVWPLYWDYSVLFLLLNACKPSGSISEIINVIQQFVYLAIVFAGLLGVLIYTLILSAKKKAVKVEGKRKKWINVKENDALALFVVQIPIQMLCLFVLGTNDGAFLTYFLQLWVPSVIIVSSICFERMIPPYTEKLSKQIRYGIIYIGIVVVTIYLGKGKLPLHILNNHDLSEWEQAYNLVEEYRKKGQVTYAKTLAYIGKEYGDDLYLTDHDGDVVERVYDNWKASKWQQELFPDADKILLENIAYREVLRERVRNHEIALVTHVGNADCAFSDEFLMENDYELLTTISLQTGNMDYDTEFWIPKEE